MASRSDRDPQEELKVVDRRLFDSHGNLRGEEPAPERPVPRAEPSTPTPPLEADRAEPRPHGREPDPDEDDAVADDLDDDDLPLTFASFVMSLAVNALVAMGEIPHPATGQPSLDLPGARQMIDILALLKEKTQGNCSPEETRILDTNLYELRMKFVEKAQGGSRG